MVLINTHDQPIKTITVKWNSKRIDMMLAHRRTHGSFTLQNDFCELSVRNAVAYPITRIAFAKSRSHQAIKRIAQASACVHVVSGFEAAMDVLLQRVLPFGA